MTTTTKPTESVDLDRLQAIADRVDARGLFNASCDIREWIVQARAALARRAPAQQEADGRAAFDLDALREAFDAEGPAHHISVERFKQRPDTYKYEQGKQMWQFVQAVFSRARATQPVGQRPTDDHLWDETLRDRDTYHEWADKLAEAIAKHFDVDIGEHSNQNCPWAEALEAIESAAPAAQAVEPAGQRAVGDLKDSDIDEIAEGYDLYSIQDGGRVSRDSLRSFARDMRSFNPAPQPSAGQAAAGPVAFMYQDDQDRDEPGTGSCVVSKARCRFYRNETPLYAAPVAATPKPAALQEKP